MFIVTILFGAGIIGYQVSLHYINIPVTETTAMLREAPGSEKAKSTDSGDGEISSNLIFCYEEETSMIDKLVLEVFSSDKKQLTYITLPMKTKVVMSDDLYRRLILEQPSAPQVLHLSAISDYLDSGPVFEYSVLLVEELLDININSFTVISKTDYPMFFKEDSAPVSGKGYTTKYPVEVFTNTFRKTLKTLDSPDEIRDYIIDLYPTLITNQSLGDKLSFLNSYSATALEDVSFQLIKGSGSNREFTIDEDEVRQQMADLYKEN